MPDTGTFDDLIPSKSAGAFDDLIPKRKASAFSGAKSKGAVATRVHPTIEAMRRNGASPEAIAEQERRLALEPKLMERSGKFRPPTVEKVQRGVAGMTDSLTNTLADPRIQAVERALLPGNANLGKKGMTGHAAGVAASAIVNPVDLAADAYIMSGLTSNATPVQRALSGLNIILKGTPAVPMAAGAAVKGGAKLAKAAAKKVIPTIAEDAINAGARAMGPDSVRGPAQFDMPAINRPSNTTQVQKAPEMAGLSNTRQINPPTLDETVAAIKAKHPEGVQLRVYGRTDGDIKLDHISVPKNLQKQGLGSAIMKDLAEYADATGSRIVLTTATKDPAFGTTSKARLVRFYKRFGFVENKGKDFSISENMFRNPKQPNVTNVTGEVPTSLLTPAERQAIYKFRDQPDVLQHFIETQTPNAADPKVAEMIRIAQETMGKDAFAKSRGQGDNLEYLLQQSIDMIKARQAGVDPVPNVAKDQLYRPLSKKEYESADPRILETIQRYTKTAEGTDGGRGVGVGGGNIEYRWRADAVELFQRAVLRGYSVDEAIALAKADAAQSITKHNSYRKGDVNWKRWEGSADSAVDNAAMLWRDSHPDIGGNIQHGQPTRLDIPVPDEGTTVPRGLQTGDDATSNADIPVEPGAIQAEGNGSGGQAQVRSGDAQGLIWDNAPASRHIPKGYTSVAMASRDGEYIGLIASKGSEARLFEYANGGGFSGRSANVTGIKAKKLKSLTNTTSVGQREIKVYELQVDSPTPAAKYKPDPPNLTLVENQASPSQTAVGATLPTSPGTTSKGVESLLTNAERQAIYKQRDNPEALKSLIEYYTPHANDPKAAEIIRIANETMQGDAFKASRGQGDNLEEVLRQSIENAQAAKRGATVVDPLDAELDAIRQRLKAKYAEPEPTPAPVTVPEPVAAPTTFTPRELSGYDQGTVPNLREGLKAAPEPVPKAPRHSVEAVFENADEYADGVREQYGGVAKHVIQRYGDTPKAAQALDYLISRDIDNVTQAKRILSHIEKAPGSVRLRSKYVDEYRGGDNAEQWSWVASRMDRAGSEDTVFAKWSSELKRLERDAYDKIRESRTAPDQRAPTPVASPTKKAIPVKAQKPVPTKGTTIITGNDGADVLKSRHIDISDDAPSEPIKLEVKGAIDHHTDTFKHSPEMEAWARQGRADKNGLFPNQKKYLADELQKQMEEMFGRNPSSRDYISVNEIDAKHHVIEKFNHRGRDRDWSGGEIRVPGDGTFRMTDEGAVHLYKQLTGSDPIINIGGKQVKVTIEKGKPAKPPSVKAADFKGIFEHRVVLTELDASSPSKLQGINSEIDALKAAQDAKNAKRPTPGKGGRSGAWQRVDAEDWELAGKLAVLYVKKGVATIEEFTANLVRDLGDAIRPHIQELWDAHGPKVKEAEPTGSGTTPPPTPSTATAGVPEPPKPKTALDFAKEASYVARGLKLGADVGALLRQGAEMAVNDPIQWVKSVGTGLSKTDKAKLAKHYQMLEERSINGNKMADVRKSAGLKTSSADAEEAFASKLFDKVPVLNKLENFQKAFLDSGRIERFDSFYRKFPDATEKELKQYAAYLNSAMGKSNVSRVPELLEVVMTAPRWTSSRWEMAGRLMASPMTVVKGINGNKAAMQEAKNLGRYAMAMYGALKVAESQGATVEFDPRSSDFLKMRVGEKVFDPTSGVAAPIRTSLRMMLFARGEGSFNANAATELGKVLTNTANPVITTPWGLITQKSLSGFDLDPEERGALVMLPLIANGAMQAWNKDGPASAMIQTGTELVGINSSRYPKSVPKWNKRKGEGTKAQQLLDKIPF